MPGYDISQRVRKRIEEVFGWMKTVGGLRKLRHRGGGPRELAVSLRRGGLQPGPHAHAGGHGMTRARRPIDRDASIDHTSRTLNRPRKSS